MDDSILRGKNVLVVDDEVDLREIVASELDFMGSVVDQAGNISAADAILKKKKIDLIISDIRMPGGTGVDLLKTVKARNILNPPVILITGFADITPEEAYAEGAEALLSKPFQLDDLIQVSARLLRPLETRFSEGPASGNKKLVYESILPVKQTPHFELGRGGFYVRTENTQKYEIGETISVSLKFPDCHIVGVGIPRWSKVSETDSKLCIGVELLRIEDSCKDYLMNHWRTTPGLAFIPKSS
jgi:CheY-like chemotaxis protein